MTAEIEAAEYLEENQFKNMSHKVDPRVYRLKDISDWKTRGYYKNPADFLEEDFRIREYLDKKIGKTGVEKIEIERFSEKLNIIIYSARPGLIIGRGGEAIEQLKKELETKILAKPALASLYKKYAKKKTEEDNSSGKKKTVKIEIKEIKDPWLSAELVAQWVAQRLEKRIPFRKVVKQAMSKVLSHKEVKGARIQVSGRLNGNEIARQEWFGSGKLPRQTIRADIDYTKEEAYCTYGVIGIKVWIYKGEKF